MKNKFKEIVILCGNLKAEVSKNDYICFYGNYGNKRVEPITFIIGDIAEYDSYNLSYTGVITKISNKTVWIVSYKGSRIKVVEMKGLID